MGSNTWRAEEWPDLVAAIRSGDPNVGARLANRERNHDNFFQVITKQDFVPVVSQAGAFTYTTYTFNGFRTGPWVELNFRCVVTNSPGAGNFAITVPAQLPIDTTDLAPNVGSFWFYDSSTGLGYHGQAIAGSSTVVNGWADGGAGFMGANAPFITGAANDQYGYNLRYLTSAVL